ncbi:histidine kinase N-terminal 7TM domain-containing protein [Halorientalis pallida]|uniref:histidine kinase n=1 Tax=Halorientalis pallida TaxID=2479928 RepID=A0A498KV97_9EURY|nr:histidine kinase N-terminal 7TM domain-containing protein [Halorientalis pallida]RXK48418.1 PAS domain-containing protein [Halorientalis pallida]
MRVQHTPYTVPLIASALLAALSAYYVQRQSDRLSASMYAWAMVSMFLWAASSAAALTAVDPLLTRVLLGSVLGFAALTTATWCLFCLSYSGYERWLSWPVLTVFGVAVASITVLSVSNPLHDLVFVERTVDTTGDWASIGHEWSPGLWVAILVVYIIHAITHVVLFKKFRRSRNLYRTFSFLLLLASLTIWLANILSVAGYSPLPHMMFVPIVFLFWGVFGLIVLASRRFVRSLPVDRFLGLLSPRSDNVVPLARDFVVEEMDSGVVILDATDYVVDVNKKAKAMLDTQERLIGKPIQEVVDLEEYFEDGLVGAESRQQIWVQSGNGDRNCYDVSVSAITGDEGTAVGRAIVMNDITNQKEREQRLRNREQELQTLKQVLSRIIRHNIRNDINVVQGNAEWIAANATGDDVTAKAEQIVATAEDLATTSRKTRIVDRVVGTEYDLIDIDLGALLTDTLADIRVDHPEATIHTDVPSDVAVRGNAYLSAAIENAIENAIVHDHSPDPTVEIDVRVDDDTVTLTIRDEGPGIPEQEMVALESGEETELIHASGIGLWLIDWIVRNSGGSVTWSNTDSGAVTRLELLRAT